SGSVRYFDAFTNDSRLVIDTLRSAAHHSATLVNYAKLVEATPQGNRWRCTVVDDQSNTPQVIETECVVNATGPWADRLPNSKTHLRTTKGVHLVVDRARLNVRDAVVMAQGSRILFAIPWGERVILGTTDTDYSGPLDNPPCDESDVAYVLDATN